MGRSTMNGYFQWQTVKLPEGTGTQYIGDYDHPLCQSSWNRFIFQTSGGAPHHLLKIQTALLHTVCFGH